MSIVTQKLIQDPDSDFIIYELIANQGGVNVNDFIDNLKDIETPNDSNCVSDPIGTITKRPGFIKKNTAQPTGSKSWNFLTQSRFKGGSEDLGSSGSTFYRVSSAGALADITNSKVITDDDDNLWDSTVLRDQLLLVNRKRDGVFSVLTTGNLESLGGTPPVGTAIERFKNRPFILGTAADPNLLYYGSKTSNGSWDTANDFLNLDEDDNDELTALRRLGERLIVWKNRKTYEITHTQTVPPFDSDLIDETIGCPSQQAHQSVSHPTKGDIIYWLSEDGNIIELVGRTPRPIGFKVQKAIKALNRSRYQFSSSGVIEELNIVFWNFSLGGGTTNSYCVTYDYLSGAFRLWPTGINANCVSQRVISNVKSTWFGDYSGNINELNNGNTDGEEVDQSFITGSDSQNLGNVTANRVVYQVFQAGVTNTLQRVRLRLKKIGTPTGNLVVRLFSVASSKPNASSQQSSTLFEVGNLTTTYQDFDFTFSLALTSGTKYAIVLTSPSISASSYIQIEESNSGGYTNGNSGNGPITAITTPGDWVEQTGADLNFTTFAGGSAIDSWRETAWLDIGRPNFIKIWRFLVILFEPTGDWNLEVEYRIDFNTNWLTPNFPTSGLVNLKGGDTVGGTFVLGTSALGISTGKEAEVELGVESKRIQFRFRNQNANEKFIIGGLGISVEPVGFHIAA